MKTAKAAAAVKRKPAAATPAPVIYNEKPDLEALSVGLPAGWKALWDKTSKEVYYANPKTKVGMPMFPPSAVRGEIGILMGGANVMLPPKPMTVKPLLFRSGIETAAGNAEEIGHVPRERARRGLLFGERERAPLLTVVSLNCDRGALCRNILPSCSFQQ